MTNILGKTLGCEAQETGHAVGVRTLLPQYSNRIFSFTLTDCVRITFQCSQRFLVGHFEFLFITIRLLRVVEDKSLLTLIKIEVHTTPVCTESNYRDQLLLNWNFVAFSNVICGGISTKWRGISKRGIIPVKQKWVKVTHEVLEAWFHCLKHEVGLFVNISSKGHTQSS